MKTAGFDNFGASGQFYSALSGIPSSVLSGIGIITGLLVIGLGAWWLFQDTPEKDTADSASGDDSRSSPITQTSSEAPETATDTNEGDVNSKWWVLIAITNVVMFVILIRVLLMGEIVRMDLIVANAVLGWVGLFSDMARFKESSVDWNPRLSFYGVLSIFTSPLVPIVSFTVYLFMRSMKLHEHELQSETV